MGYFNCYSGLNTFSRGRAKIDCRPIWVHLFSIINKVDTSLRILDGKINPIGNKLKAFKHSLALKLDNDADYDGIA